MVYFSGTIVHGSGGRVLMPWKIVQCHSEAIPSVIYHTLLLPRLALSVYAGEPEAKGLYRREILNLKIYSFFCLSQY